MLQHVHDVVLVFFDVLPAAEPRAAALDEDAGHAVQRRAVVRARGRGGADQIFHINLLCHLPRLFDDFFRGIAGKISVGMQILLQVAAVQVKIVIHLENKLMQQKISELVSAAERSVAGKDAVQIQSVLGAELRHAGPKRRYVHGVHDDEAAVDILGLQFLSQFHGSGDARILASVHTGRDKHGRAVIFPVDDRHRDGVQRARHVHERAQLGTGIDMDIGKADGM